MAYHPATHQVLTALRACGGFISAQNPHAALVADGVAVGLTTGYRTLRLLETARHVDVVRDRDGERLFRPRPGEGHRHYLVCREVRAQPRRRRRGGRAVDGQDRA
ncbi:transcriptional repressor [Streptomyces collinus]|uniref:transcriptional repressor n=1 Tax=Streptomyces collinus TaxID=42684 RepID=UPI00367725E4